MPVLIRGETGTGKQLVARAALSERAVRISLCRAELRLSGRHSWRTTSSDTSAGHSPTPRGRRDGLIADGERGTLFLHKVGTLSGRAQVTRLRVRQDKVFRELGSSREVKAEVRFIAAPNTSLVGLVQASGFRAVPHRVLR
jgi:DNA-binding NtrC family response regulator